MILIPVKNLSTAKQRLAAVLDQTTRTLLAQTMLRDVVEAVASASHWPEVALVTSDPFAIELAGQFHFQVIPDQNNLSETDAIAMATEHCEARGVESTLVIPGDIPLITADELEEIFRAAPSEGALLVPAADGRGTNAILRRPAALFPLRFGNDSFQPHLASANASGKSVIVLELPGIALDIDSPSDLRQLAAAAGEKRSQRLVRQWKPFDIPEVAVE
jgi:2-phospho-L-lactate guanylyltransferase